MVTSVKDLAIGVQKKLLRPLQKLQTMKMGRTLLPLFSLPQFAEILLPECVFGAKNGHT